LFNQERILSELSTNFERLQHEIFSEKGLLQKVFREDMERLNEIYEGMESLLQAAGPATALTMAEHFALGDQDRSKLRRAKWKAAGSGTYGFANSAVQAAVSLSIGIATGGIGLIVWGTACTLWAGARVLIARDDAIRSFRDIATERLRDAADEIKTRLRQLQPKLEAVVRGVTAVAYKGPGQEQLSCRPSQSH
jgi:hypothetical protein